MSKKPVEQIRIWVEKIIESDRGAFDSLFRSLYPRLVRFAYKFVKNKSVAGDIVQDAFVILWENRRDLDPQKSVKSYLYRIVRNRSLNYIRDHSSETVGLESLNGDRVKMSDNPEQNEETEQLMEMLKEWIKDLPQRQKEAFELSRFEGLDHDEIAGVMEVSSNTVNNHIVAALNHLRERYDVYKNKVNNA